MVAIVCPVRNHVNPVDLIGRLIFPTAFFTVKVGKRDFVTETVERKYLGDAETVFELFCLLRSEISHLTMPFS